MYKKNAFVLLFFIVFSIIVTSPLIFNFTESIPYDFEFPSSNKALIFKAQSSDVWLHLWNLWWIKHSLLYLKTNPYFTNLFFHPQGTHLYLHSLNLAGGIISIPFQYAFNLQGAYNTMFLLSFILSGFFMYKLAYYFTEDTLPSVTAGIIYMMSPYHFEHVYHLEHMSIQWVPVFVYTFIRAVKERRYKYLVFSIVFFIIIFYTDLYASVTVSILSVILLVSFFSYSKQLVNLMLIFILFVLISVLPVVIPIISESLKFDYMKSPDKIYIANSADILSFFVPPYFNSMFGTFTAKIYNNFTGTEKCAYLGYTTLILSFFGLKENRFKKLFLSIFLLFTMLALGPYLHVNGNVLSIPLPYLILKQIPFLSSGRVPIRFILIDYLVLSILSAYGIKYLLCRTGRFWVLYIFILIFISNDYTPKPLAFVDLKYDEFYDRLASEKEDFAVCEVPITEWPEPLQYYQSIHKKPILAGMITYINPESYKFIFNTPLLLELYNPTLITEEKDLSYYLKGIEIMKQNKIKYIIFHEMYFHAKTREIYNILFENVLKLEKFYSSEEIKVYKI
ncbi:MAG: hypothetical protein AB1765_12485 [Candidatus Hydrogenedentota bacterium]